MNEIELKEQAKRAFESYFIFHLRKTRKQCVYYTKASSKKKVIEFVCEQLQITPESFKSCLSDINICKRIIEICK